MQNIKKKRKKFEKEGRMNKNEMETTESRWKSELNKKKKKEINMRKC